MRAHASMYVEGFDELGYHEKNPYYNPERFRLEVVDTIENGGSYEFDTTILWKHEGGMFFLGHDVGCSCPTPFDGFDFHEGIEPVRGFDDLMRQLEGIGGIHLSQAHEMYRKARAAGL